MGRVGGGGTETQEKKSLSDPSAKYQARAGKKQTIAGEHQLLIEGDR